jgi:predicted DNA-binding transcriptional regulator YafY
MSRKGQSITLSVKETEKQALEALADRLGYTWGDKPNISKLITAIAQQKYRLTVNDNWTETQIKALDQAWRLLVDLGKIPEAEEIARILVERSELQILQRQALDAFLDKPIPTWRKQIEIFIKESKPFRLTYQDASDRTYNFTIVHARIQLLESHQYLVCTCDENEGNEDIPELNYNWCLRLDRIQDAVVNPIKLPWQTQLDQVTVQFQVYNRLAFNYGKSSNKPDDLTISDLEGDPPQRTITRNIFSTFWFFRDIAPYWEDCQILAPDSVRNKFQTKLQLLYDKYFIKE